MQPEPVESYDYILTGVELKPDESRITGQEEAGDFPQIKGGKSVFFVKKEGLEGVFRLFV